MADPEAGNVAAEWINNFIDAYEERAASGGDGSGSGDDDNGGGQATNVEQFREVMTDSLTNVIENVGEMLTPAKVKELFNYLIWNREVKTLKEAWKGNIFPGGKVKGYGFKVDPRARGRRQRSDDDVYAGDPELQYNLPRGIVFIKDFRDQGGSSRNNNSAGDDDGWTTVGKNKKKGKGRKGNQRGGGGGDGDDSDEADGEGKLDLVLFANRKFYGRKFGDDDDTDRRSATVENGDYAHFLVSTKANGENCQVALCPDGETWLVGSKNRKIAIRGRDNINQYRKDKQYTFAAEMADCFIDVIGSLGVERANELKRFLSATRLTLNFELEAVAHQHIVFLEETRLVLIGLTGYHIPGTALHPALTACFGSYFGFPSVVSNLTLYAPDRLNKVCKTVAKGWNDEGAVLILLDEDMLVKDLVKVKTWWYVLLRAMREKLRGVTSMASARTRALRTTDRLRTLQGLMSIPQRYIDVFIRLSGHFARYVAEDESRMQNFDDQYPLIWTAFLESLGLPTDDGLMHLEASDFPPRATFDDLPTPLLLFTQGIPGAGKSFLAGRLVAALNAAGIAAVQVAQDDFAHLGKKKSGARCFAHVKGLLEGGDYKVVILARNNGNGKQYRKYLGLDANDGLCKTAFIAPEEAETDRVLDLAYLSACSVLRRKASNDDHPTDEMNARDLAALPFRFLGEYEPYRAAFRYRLLSDNALPYPDGAAEALADVVAAGRARGFSWEGFASDADLGRLGLTDPAVQEAVAAAARRDINEVVADIMPFIEHAIEAPIPPAFSYLAIKLSTGDSEAMAACISYDDDWNVFAEHVTLVHSLDFFARREMWDEALSLQGTPVIVTPVEIVVQANRLVCVAVTVAAKADGTDLVGIVASGVPHVTIATAHRVQAVESIDVLKAGDRSGQQRIDAAVAGLAPFEGVIQLVSN